MKKITVLSVIVASLLLVGCGEEATKEIAPVAVEPAKTETVAEKATKAVDAVKDVASAVAEKTEKVATEAKEVMAQKATEAVASTKEVASAVAEKTAEVATGVKEAVGGVDLTACAACHGAEFEKKAMGVSKIVKDMSKEEIITALKGYNDGSYGANMKALMKGQVASFDDAKIDAVATQIVK